MGVTAGVERAPPLRSRRAPEAAAAASRSAGGGEANARGGEVTARPAPRTAPVAAVVAVMPVIALPEGLSGSGGMAAPEAEASALAGLT